jgi:hypothetical protein
MKTNIKLKNGQTLEIIQDEFGESPREWDNICEMICFHKRYDLGDKHNIKSHDYSSWEEMIDANSLPSDIVVPLYFYDHGGIAISTSPFSCPWDSGQIGFAIIPVNKIVLEYGDDSDISRANARRVLQGEVNTYNQYLQGEVFGYVLKDEAGEEIDSCWGFFGYDPTTNGIFDNLGLGQEDVA